MAGPSSPAEPRTFTGDPNPPPEKLEAPPSPKTSTAAPTSAGTGALPPGAPKGEDNRDKVPTESDRTYNVVERPNGSYDAFVSDARGDSKLWTASNPDAKHILEAVGGYDPLTKTFNRVPEDIIKSLGTGRLGFPERISNAWEGGEAGVLRSLIGAKLMYGEMPLDQAKEEAHPLLLKARIDTDPGIAWQGGFGKTVASMLKHPVDTAEAALVGTAGMAPLMKDLLLHGTAPYAAAGATAGATAAGAGIVLSGPLAPEVATAAVVNGMRVGAQYGTFKRAMDVMGGGFAMDMADKGYDQKTIQKYAPLVGLFNGALTLMQFDLMTPAMQSKALGGVLGSSAVKTVMNSWATKYAAHVAGFAALGDMQEAINIFAGNMAATATDHPELLTSGPEAKKRLLETTLQMSLVGGVMAGAGVAATGGWRLISAAEREGGGASLPRPGESRLPEPGSAPASSSELPGTEGTRESPSLKPGQTADALSPYDASVARNPDKSKGGFGSHEGIAKAGEIHPELMAEADKLVQKPPKEMADILKGKGLLEHVMGALSEESREQFKMFSEVDPAKLDEKQAGHFADSLDRAIKRYRLGTEEPLPPGIEEKADALRARATPATEPEYVKNRPFDIKPGETDKATAAAVREQFAGIKNEQIVRGNQLADELRRIVPSKEDRAGLFWYKAAEGNKAILEDALRQPELEKYHGEIERALKLSPEALAALPKVDKYYAEAGAAAKDAGVLKDLRENYQNRIYAPEKPTDFVKSEGGSGIKQTTRHAKQRVFDTEFDAARAGKTFATTDVADSLAIHNEEMARVNTARRMADAMKDAGLGAWKREVPEGWAKVGSLEKNMPIKDKNGEAVIGEDGNQIRSKSVFVAPEGIAKGLRAISDPDFTKKIDALRGIQRWQGLVKTVDLSFSFFHHFSMLAQSVYQRDVSTLMDLPYMSKMLEHPDFAKNEQDFALHGGMTAEVEANQDILRGLHEKIAGDNLEKLKDLPVVKQMLEQTDKNSQFLFGKLQRFLKVSNYANEAAAWVAEHPEATNAQVLEAKRGIARNVNVVFGGLNWEAMGMTKSNLSLLRLGMLAPDWTISNLALLKQAVGEGGTSGHMARAHIISSLAIGMIATEGLNKLLTGHFTEDNKPGHKLEVEIAPDVYVSLLRGGIGDITKFASMVAESGLAGVGRFAQGKLAPFPRTGVGLLTNTQYTGAPIVPKNSGPVAGTYDVLKFAMQSLTPMPLGISNLLAYATTGHEPGVVGAAGVATGVGRFSKGKR